MNIETIFLIIFITLLTANLCFTNNVRILEISNGEKMEPKIEQKLSMLLVGMVESGPTVSDIDIHGLWQIFQNKSDSIKHKVYEKGYEMHIDIENDEKIHYCICGVQIDEIEDIPLGMFVTEVPAGTYAVFTHCFKDGYYAKVFEYVNNWIKNSKYDFAFPFDIQVYDKRFKGPDNPESVFEILVPVKEK